MEITKFAIAIIFTLLIFAGLGIVELIAKKFEKKKKRKSKIIKMPVKKESHFYNFIIK